MTIFVKICKVCGFRNMWKKDIEAGKTKRVRCIGSKCENMLEFTEWDDKIES